MCFGRALMYYSFVELVEQVDRKRRCLFGGFIILVLIVYILYQQYGQEKGVGFCGERVFYHFFDMRLGLKSISCFLLSQISTYIYGVIVKTNRVILFSQFGLELSLLVFLKWQSILDFKQLQDF